MTPVNFDGADLRVVYIDFIGPNGISAHRVVLN